MTENDPELVEMTELAEPTELAGAAEAQTESAYAWSSADLGAEEYPPTTVWERIGPRRVTAAAVAASVLALVGAAVGGFFVLRSRDQPTSLVVVKPTVVTTVATATATVTAPPPPPPSTVTVRAPAPTIVQHTIEANPWTPAEDQRLIDTLRSQNWSIWDPTAVILQAHNYCATMRAGATPQSIVDELTGPNSHTTVPEAQAFVSAIMATYEHCP